MTNLSLGVSLARGRNSLNAVRLLLAVAVILGHTTPLGGFASTPLDRTSGLAVDGFFVLSGFLIAGSRVRLGLGRYLWHRALRILPGFWACLVVVAFGFAPIVALDLGEHWSLASALGFVGNNALLQIHQWGVGGTLATVPYDGVWDGSLWTLWFEAAAYVVAGVLLSSAIVRRHLRGTLLALALLATAAVPLAHGPLAVSTSMYLNGLRLGACFVVGMLLWSYRDSIPRSAPLIGLSVVLVGVLFFQPDLVSHTLVPLPLGYLLLVAGSGQWSPVALTDDISYGVYVYAFPVQQVLVVAGAAALGMAQMFALAVVLTVPLAWLSWRIVERPALRLKHVELPTTPAQLPTWVRLRTTLSV